MKVENMTASIFEERGTNAMFRIHNGDADFRGHGILKESTIHTIAFNPVKDQQVVIDEVPYTFPAQTALPLVANQHFQFERPEEIIAWQFNREFYCIVNHDAEVGCVGFLFYGIRHPLFINMTAEDVSNIKLLESLTQQDMGVKDRMQGEMLRTLLKRLIINLTRMARNQSESCREISDTKLDLVRMFNLLLEGHYKTHHEVQFYAKKLNKSAKTLSNLFLLLNFPSPSKLIQDRIILEAKRYLHYTDKSAKEIAYSLGFTTPAHFSRFFKQHNGGNITEFRSQDLQSI